VAEQNQAAGALVGVVLDDSYRIERLLGEGGMGAVYHATHLRLDKPVAVKVMARDLAANQEALERFRREARVTSGLGHPHIVQVFDFSATPAGEPFLVMEFLEGEDLDRRLRGVGRVPLKEVVHIVRQVASALSATHAKAIVHRDLKPGNIYLLEVAGERDFVKVLDFGISKVRSASTKLTRTSSIMGTPNYMSPEQAKGKVEEIDERTDQWALACIAWECLSGEGPFVGENVPSILFQIVHEPPAALAPKVEGLVPQVEDVLLRALSKNKADRFPNVGDFAAALEAASTDQAPVHNLTAVLPARTMRLPDGENPASSVPKTTTFTQTTGEVEDTFDKLPTRPKWVVGVVGAGALLAVTMAVILLRSGPRPKSAVVSPPPEQPVQVFVPPVPSAPEPRVVGVAVPAIEEPPQPSLPAPAPAVTPPEPTGTAAPSRKQESKRKVPGGPTESSHPLESLPAPAGTMPLNDHPFEAKAKTRERAAPPAGTIDVNDDPFEAKAKTHELHPASPQRKEWEEQQAPSTKPTKLRSKEEQWRVE
jgi:serine/threonine-protein kinase